MELLSIVVIANNVHRKTKQAAREYNNAKEKKELLVITINKNKTNSQTKHIIIFYETARHSDVCIV
jgi:hypothetical protein